MTDDLRTRARVVAEREYSQGDELGDSYLRDAFIAGALWHAALQPTREQIEDALSVGMLGTTDGEFIDPESDVPIGEAHRLATLAVLALLNGAGS